MRKRRKLYHFSDMVKDKIDFFDFSRVVNGNGAKGTRYTLSNRLTDEQREKLSKYDNVIMSECHYKYAQELRYDTLILLD